MTGEMSNCLSSILNFFSLHFLNTMWVYEPICDHCLFDSGARFDGGLLPWCAAMGITSIDAPARAPAS